MMEVSDCYGLFEPSQHVSIFQIMHTAKWIDREGKQLYDSKSGKARYLRKETIQP